MKTMLGTPARAACAATELARLPVEAQAKRLKPRPRAAVRATETTRSLNEWVGLAESSLTHSGAPTPPAAARGGRRPPGGSQGGRAHQRGQAGVESDPGGRVLTGREQPRVPPDVLRAGLDLLTGHPRECGLVVGHLERAETLVTGMLGDQRVCGAARAADEAAGRGVGGRGCADGRRHRGLPLIFPRSAACRTGDGISTCRARPLHRDIRGGCRGFTGPFPLPLWMRYSVVFPTPYVCLRDFPPAESRGVSRTTPTR